MFQLTRQHVSMIESHARRAYPRECCGFLLGRELWKVEAVVPATNAKGEEEMHNRFVITPVASLRAEKEARRLGLSVIGHYHSHPDCAAVPSTPRTVSASKAGGVGESDLENATWPGYAFVIVSVVGGEPAELTCWNLAEERSKFEPIAVKITGSLPS